MFFSVKKEINIIHIKRKDIEKQNKYATYIISVVDLINYQNTDLPACL